MKRLGHTGNGQVIVIDEDAPRLSPRKAVVRTHFAGISAGTETRGMLARRENPVELDEPNAFGYSNSGVVEQAGSEVTHVEAGREVACYGGPYVRHAELNAVPRHLVKPLPQGVPLREAAFGGIGTIAVHMARSGGFTFGEKVLVVGLGILGNMTAQVLSAAGVDVLASEIIPFRRARAAEVGLRTFDPASGDLAAEVKRWTGGTGIDGAIVLISDKNVELLNDIFRLCRERGRIVVAGGGGTGYDRELVFKKELAVLHPRAGGPGRYDPWYEEEGNDYPIGFVRWTEGRNLEAWLWLVATGRIKVNALITHEFAFEDAQEAFNLLIDRPGESLGVLLRFSE